MITIVLSYYDNGGMLDRHFQEWRDYPLYVQKHFRAIIVDDGSPNDPAIDHVGAKNFSPLPLEIYRIKENIPWNIPGARNLGMKMAPEGWCLLTDIDHLLTADQAKLLPVGAGLYRGNIYYSFSRRWADGRPLHPHSNSYLITRDLYWRCGGTDEDYSGRWGAGEGPFRKNLQAVGALETTLPVFLTHFGRDDIGDASTREWGRKGSDWDYNNDPKLKAKARGPAYKPENPLRFDWERLV